MWKEVISTNKAPVAIGPYSLGIKSPVGEFFLCPEPLVGM